MFGLTEASTSRRAVGVGRPIAASSGSILAGAPPQGVGSLQANKQHISTVIPGNKQFLIPVFQRDYS